MFNVLLYFAQFGREVTGERIVTETLARWLLQESAPLDHLASLRLHDDCLLFEPAPIRVSPHS